MCTCLYIFTSINKMCLKLYSKSFWEKMNFYVFVTFEELSWCSLWYIPFLMQSIQSSDCHHPYWTPTLSWNQGVMSKNILLQIIRQSNCIIPYSWSIDTSVICIYWTSFVNKAIVQGQSTLRTTRGVSSSLRWKSPIRCRKHARAERHRTQL